MVTEHLLCLERVIGMNGVINTIRAVQELESRQDELLKKLDELDQRIISTLKELGCAPAQAKRGGESPEARYRAICEQVEQKRAA